MRVIQEIVMILAQWHRKCEWLLKNRNTVPERGTEKQLRTRISRRRGETATNQALVVGGKHRESTPRRKRLELLEIPVFVSRAGRQR